MAEKITVNYGGKEVEKDVVCDGVVKTGNAFLVRCIVTGEWTYCNQERLDKLVARFGGTVEDVGTKYVGRAGKRSQKISEQITQQLVTPITNPIAATIIAKEPEHSYKAEAELVAMSGE